MIGLMLWVAAVFGPGANWGGDIPIENEPFNWTHLQRMEIEYHGRPDFGP